RDAAQSRACAAAGRHLRGDFRDLRQPRRSLAEPDRRGRSGRGVSPRLEDPARARQSPRPLRIRLSVIGGRARGVGDARRRTHRVFGPALLGQARGRAGGRRPASAECHRRPDVSDRRVGAPSPLPAKNPRRPHAGGDLLMMSTLATAWASLPGIARTTVWIVIVTVALIICVALLTLWERKVIGWMQLRRGPNRVRIFGLFPGLGQPFADVFKLLAKEVVIPTNANKFLFRIAPMIALIP